MLKKLSKNLRNVYLMFKSSIIEEKREGEVLDKSGLVGVKIHEMDGSTSYELAEMKLVRFKTEIIYFTSGSKRKIYESQKGVKNVYVEEMLPIQEIIKSINKKYGKDVISNYCKGLTKQEVDIITNELPKLFD